MRLLLAEDDKHIGAAAKAGLAQEGHAVDWAQNGTEAVHALKTHQYDCLLLDLGLPDIPGESLLKAMRARNDSTPVIVITARGQVQDRIDLLDVGADDYIVKPFDIDELAARLRAIVRRTTAPQDMGADLEYGPLRLSPASRAATWHGEIVPLTNKEFWVLETFLRKKGRVLTRRQLEEALYGWGDEIESNAVEVYIHHLRRKFSSSLIHTIRGVGYQLGLDTNERVVAKPATISEGENSSNEPASSTPVNPQNPSSPIGVVAA
jgi:DNA-binding response OmpR family regulator